MPLPEGPTTPSKGTPTARATSSATSRSRPKKYRASATSKLARPLNGHTSDDSCPASRLSVLAGGLKVDDALDELLLGPTQLGAAGRRARNRRAHAARRLAPCPGAGNGMDLAGNAAARLEQLLDEDVRNGVARRVAGRDVAHGVGAERPQRESDVGAGRGQTLVTLGNRQPEHRRARQLARQLSDRGERGVARVGVVHDEQRGTRRLPRAPRRCDHASGRSQPEAYRTAPPARWTSAASSAASRVLPMPTGPLTTTSSPAPARARSQRAPSHASSRSRPTSATAAPARSSSGSPSVSSSSAASWRRIASCNSRSSGPGSTPISSTSNRRALAKRLQRLGLAPAAIEREHPLTAQALAQRVLGHERLELGHQIGVAAERQVGVDAPLQRHRAPLLEPGDLGLRERLVRDVGQRGPAPQRQGLAQPRRRVAGSVERERLPTVVHQPLEAVEVELAVLHVDHVSAASRLKAPPLAVVERATQLTDVVLQHLRRRRRRRLAPQGVDHPLAPHRLVAMQQQEDQDAAQAALTEPDRAIPVGDLERAQQAIEH